uniref:(northern house mosquito) hypothetical protein n=1 Tax=Culex pipiens TaxID=7175 RepID=A0A8D8HYY8_CULPI
MLFVIVCSHKFLNQLSCSHKSLSLLQQISQLFIRLGCHLNTPLYSLTKRNETRNDCGGIPLTVARAWYSTRTRTKTIERYTNRNVFPAVVCPFRDPRIR